MKLELALTCAMVFAIDGDTLRCDTKSVRLLGYDSAEMHKGSRTCQKKAVAAQIRLDRILDAPGWRLVPKRTRDGRMRRGRYGRVLAWLYVDGEDVAMLMVREGLGRAYKGGKRRKGC